MTTAYAETGASQFPKRCACGRSHTATQWSELDRVGIYDDGEERIELRNCQCKSTIGIVLARSVENE